MNGNAVSVYGTVIGKEMHKSAGGTELYLILKQENNCCFVCSVLTEEEPVIGSYVCISGTFYIYERATNPGQFDAAQYYASQRIYGRILTESCFVIRPPSGITGVFFRGKEQLFKFRRYLCSRLFQLFGAENGALLSAMLLGERVFLDEEIKSVYRDAGIFHIVAISGVKTLKLGIPLVPETRINWAFVPLHIAIIYILKLCLDEEIIPRCRFPCSRGYFKKCVNWQKKQ